MALGTLLKKKCVSVVCTFCVPFFTGSGMCLAQNPQPLPNQQHLRYALQRQDVISLTFPLSPELNQTLTIQPDGYINLQNAGNVSAKAGMGGLYVQGMTLPELVAAVRKAYEGVLREPIINADLLDFQKPFFSVSGQVGKPGQYELRSDLTVSEAIAVAGGMTSVTAKTQVFLFHRASQNWYEVQNVNLKKVLGGKGLSEDQLLRPGDMIYVPEKFIANFKKYVPYTVNLGTYFQSPLNF